MALTCFQIFNDNTLYYLIEKCVNTGRSHPKPSPNNLLIMEVGVVDGEIWGERVAASRDNLDVVYLAGAFWRKPTIKIHFLIPVLPNGSAST